MSLNLDKAIQDREEGTVKPTVEKKAEGIRRITMHERDAWKTVKGEKIPLGDGEYDEIFENLGMTNKKGNANNLVPIILDISRLIKNGDLVLTEEAEERLAKEATPQPKVDPPVPEEEGEDDEEEEEEVIEEEDEDAEEEDEE